MRALLISIAVAIAASLPGAPTAAQAQRVDVIIRFADAPTASDLAALHGVGGEVRFRYSIIPGVAATLPQQAIDALRANPRVAVVELDGPVTALDYRSTHDWGIAHVRADEVHQAETGTTGAGVTVAVLDSGIDCDHVELPQTRCNYAWNYVDGTADADDDWGHGTHVAGTIAAELNVGATNGVVGVAPGATVASYKILDQNGVGDWGRTIAAIDDIWNDGGTPRAQVVNMSFGSSTAPSSVQTAMDRAYAAGIALVGAAGNGGRCAGKGNSIIYPAGYSSVIAASAVDQANERPCWSSTGEELELAAPGVSVYSTWASDLSTSPRDPQPVCEGTVCHYKYGSGTSMSSPHVAGVAALVIASGQVSDQNGANGTADELRQRLATTALDLGPAGHDTLYGYGLVDAAAALGLAEEPSDPGDGGATGISLGARGYKVAGVQTVDLTWSGATSTSVDVVRDGTVVTTTANDGGHTDNIGKRGGGSYRYRVCEAGTQTCSNEVLVEF